MFSRSILIILLLLPSAWSRRYLKPGPKTKNTKSSAPSFQPSSSEKASPGADDFDQLRPVFDYVRYRLGGRIVSTSFSFGGKYGYNKGVIEEQDKYPLMMAAIEEQDKYPLMMAASSTTNEKDFYAYGKVKCDEIFFDESMEAQIPCVKPTVTEARPSIEYRPAASGSIITTTATYKSTLEFISATFVCTMLDGKIKQGLDNIPAGVQGRVTCNIDICFGENDCLFLRSTIVEATYTFKPSVDEVVGVDGGPGDMVATITAGSGRFMGYIGEARVGKLGMALDIAAIGFPGRIPGGDIWSFGEQKPVSLDQLVSQQKPAKQQDNSSF